MLALKVWVRQVVAVEELSLTFQQDGCFVRSREGDQERSELTSVAGEGPET